MDLRNEMGTRRVAVYGCLLVATILALLQVQCGKESALEKLPELPAGMAGELKAIPGTGMFVVQPAKMPKTVSAAASDGKPTNVIYAKKCAGTTVYQVQAAYPVPICHPMLDDVRAPLGGASAMARTTGATKNWEAAGAAKYKLTTNVRVPMVCTDARMPVMGELTTITTCGDGADQHISYMLDLNGLITLVWNGDKDARPDGLTLFGDWTFVSDQLSPCSGTSTSQCGVSPGDPGDGGGIHPAIAKPK